MSRDAVEDWERELALAGSQTRGYVLLDLYHERRDELTDDELRRLVEKWWILCEAWGDRLDDALDMLADVRPEGPPLPAGTLTVYRTTGGESRMAAHGRLTTRWLSVSRG